MVCAVRERAGQWETKTLWEAAYQLNTIQGDKTEGVLTPLPPPHPTPMNQFSSLRNLLSLLFGIFFHSQSVLKMKYTLCNICFHFRANATSAAGGKETTGIPSYAGRVRFHPRLPTLCIVTPGGLPAPKSTQTGLPFRVLAAPSVPERETNFPVAA